MASAWPVAANRSRRRAMLPCKSTPCHRRGHMMNETTNVELEQEPIGIVISRGTRLEHVPSVFAYVWASAPEISDEDRKTSAV